MSVRFKLISDFTTADPKRLNRELSQFEDNVSEALLQLDGRFKQLVSVAGFTTKPSSAATVAALLPNQQLSVNTSNGAASVVLPALSPSNFGAEFRLIKSNAGGGNITVFCQDKSVFLDGVALPFTILACGRTSFYCDKAGYYT